MILPEKSLLFCFLVLAFTVLPCCCVQADDYKQVIENFEFSSTDFKLSGETWTLEGKTALVSPNNVSIKDVKAIGNYPDQTISLKADKGDFNPNTQDLSVESDVEVASSDGFFISTQRLNWYADTREVSTDTEVELKKGNIVARAIGAIAKSGFSNITLLKKPYIRFSNSSMEIRCLGPLLLDTQANSATFKNQVCLLHDGRELKADEVVAYLNDQGNDIERMVAVGDVEIRQGDNLSHSDRVEYFPKQARLLMEGRPKLYLTAKNDHNDLAVLDDLSSPNVKISP